MCVVQYMNKFATLGQHTHQAFSQTRQALLIRGFFSLFQNIERFLSSPAPFLVFYSKTIPPFWAFDACFFSCVPRRLRQLVTRQSLFTLLFYFHSIQRKMVGKFVQLTSITSSLYAKRGSRSSSCNLFSLNALLYDFQKLCSRKKLLQEENIDDFMEK